VTVPSAGDRLPECPAVPLVNAEELTDFMRAAFPGQELTWEIGDVTDEGLVVRCPVRSEQSRPGGTLSGPALMSFADGAAYVTVLARIGLQALAVTTNLNINFLRRPKLETVRVDTHLLRIGRTSAVVETTLFTDGEHDPIAHAVVTYSLALVNRGAVPDGETT
jgi:uncharacterized protein (TIGR00369 family)